jgi:hypothetical protein
MVDTDFRGLVHYTSETEDDFDLRNMKPFLLVLLLAPGVAFGADGMVPESEISLGGVTIGESSERVTTKLGAPLRKVDTGEFIEYEYPHVRVSFGENEVAGLYTDDPQGCTPMRLCPGDRLDEMRSMYGAPIVATRETGRFFEYYAADFTCWLKISAQGDRIASIAVACQP